MLVGLGTNLDDVVVENASVFKSTTNNVAFTQWILDNDTEF